MLVPLLVLPLLLEPWCCCCPIPSPSESRLPLRLPPPPPPPLLVLVLVLPLPLLFLLAAAAWRTDDSKGVNKRRPVAPLPPPPPPRFRWFPPLGCGLGWAPELGSSVVVGWAALGNVTVTVPGLLPSCL